VRGGILDGNDRQKILHENHQPCFGPAFPTTLILVETFGPKYALLGIAEAAYRPYLRLSRLNSMKDMPAPAKAATKPTKTQPRCGSLKGNDRTRIAIGTALKYATTRPAPTAKIYSPRGIRRLWRVVGVS